MTKFQKQIKTELLAAAIAPDNIKVKRDGTVEVRRGYFYRHGNTGQLWVEEVSKKLSTPATVKGGDHWDVYPKPSYFYAIISEVKNA